VKLVPKVTEDEIDDSGGDNDALNLHAETVQVANYGSIFLTN
jgi:hypothetical protein